MGSLRRALGDLVRSLSANERSFDGTTALWPRDRKAAEDQAMHLLIGNLSTKQREQYRTLGYFEVLGGDSGRRYRIRRGYQLNIEELDEKGRRIRMWCFLPEGRIPVADIMLAQKMALELFESDALRVAHRSPMGGYTLDDPLLLVRRYRRH
jgi:hypothetical protein